MNTPVLFIIFKRKNEALTAIDAIRKVAPKRFYIAADGPRQHVENEDVQTKETRDAVLAAIDWPCEVFTKFEPVNLGCGPAVRDGITWFFDHEESGIIMEDDCVALPSFFTFCEELLERFKDDDRIGLISGFNNIKSDFSPYSYTFSKYTVCWGWASWRRAWNNMEYDMGWLDTPAKSSVLRNAGYMGKDKKYWERRVDALKNKTVNTWDYQWCFTVAAQNQLGVFPNKNLISNIGIGDGATHTTKNPFSSYTSQQDIDFPLVHPEHILPNMEFDHAFYTSRNSFITTVAWFVPKPIKDFIKRAMLLVYNKK